MELNFQKLKFGSEIDKHWNLLQVLDENDKETNFIAVRGEFWTKESEIKFNELVNENKKFIGLSSYQCFPRLIPNPYENGRVPTKEKDIFINKYGKHIILWCHCFKDPQNFIPANIPLLLHSETDYYANVDFLKSKANTIPKKYDFFVSIQEGRWNSWIRGLDIAKQWLNYMAERMNLKILICGNNRRSDFSKKIDIIEFLPWADFIDKMNSCKYLFCASRYDASPRIIIEALALDIPVLLNENILGGWKYINKRTGEFFFQDEFIKDRIERFMAKKYEPLKWITNNFNAQSNMTLLADTCKELCSRKYTDFFDGIMYINLENRKDRNTSIINELENMEIPLSLVTRIDAVKNTICGHLGCTESHIKALKYAKQMKWKYFLILEDDFKFSVVKERLLYIISEFLKKYNNDWDVLMFAATYHEVKDTDQNFIKKIIYGTTTSGYFVNSNYIDILLANFEEGKNKLKLEVNNFIKTHPGQKLYESSNALDQHWFSLQKNDRFFIVEPFIGDQDHTSNSSIMS